MMNLVNPLNLTDELVRIKHESGVALPPAVVEKKGRTYFITINDHFVEKFPTEYREIVKLGLIYHEIAHVKYESFSRPVAGEQYTNQIHKYIDNLIEDIRIENNIGCDYPLAGRFVEMTSKQMKKVEAIHLDRKLEDKVKQQLLWLYLIVRYGVIPKDATQEFVDFVVPYSLVATRSNRAAAYIASKIIHDYIMFDVVHESKDVSLENVGVLMGELSKDDIEQIQNQIDMAKDKVAEMSKDIDHKDIMENIIQTMSDDLKESGAIDGSNRIEALETINNLVADVVNEVDTQSDFYNSVCREMAAEIDMLSNIVKQIITKHSNIKVYEGDLNIKRMQDAYMSSLVGDSGRDYLQNRIEKADFDCLILRDTSFSTNVMKFDYSKALIMMVEALELNNIRNMVVNFDSQVTLVKLFGEHKNKGKFGPRAHGSTRLAAAMESIKGQVDWKNKNRLGIIITDGAISDRYFLEDTMDKSIYKDTKFVVIQIKDRGGYDYPKQVIKTLYIDDAWGLPEALAKIINCIRF
jgi:hypothetical protein